MGRLYARTCVLQSSLRHTHSVAVLYIWAIHQAGAFHTCRGSLFRYILSMFLTCGVGHS